MGSKSTGSDKNYVELSLVDILLLIGIVVVISMVFKKDSVEGINEEQEGDSKAKICNNRNTDDNGNATTYITGLRQINKGKGSSDPPDHVAHGICKSMGGGKTDICHNICDESDCKSQGGVCYFQDFNDIYSYSGGLEGSVWKDWMYAIGLVDKNGKRINTNIVSADGTDPDKAGTLELHLTNTLSIKDKDNILKSLGINTEADVDSSKYVPNSLKSTVKSYVKACRVGWKDNSDIYNKNGNGPIMNYNKLTGLQCQNPYYEPIVQPGTIPRIFSGYPVCPTPHPSQGPCPMTSDCNWGPTDGWVDSASQHIWNNLPGTDSGACGLPDCANTHPGLCFKNTVGNTVNDAAAYVRDGFWDIYRSL